MEAVCNGNKIQLLCQYTPRQIAMLRAGGLLQMTKEEENA